jgi:hypothetical protein
MQSFVDHLLTVAYHNITSTPSVMMLISHQLLDLVGESSLRVMLHQ